ncbi:hypothetical protein ACFX12_003040 [Malus domestica]
MEQMILELKLISAKDFKDVHLISKIGRLRHCLPPGRRRISRQQAENQDQSLTGMQDPSHLEAERPDGEPPHWFGPSDYDPLQKALSVKTLSKALGQSSPDSTQVIDLDDLRFLLWISRA